jgi:hypothetical protein
MNKLFRHLGNRIVLNLALCACPVLAQTLPDQPSAPPVANAWEQRDMDANMRRLVLLHREQTDTLSGASFDRQLPAPWPDSPQAVSGAAAFARSFPAYFGAADSRAN